MQRIGQKTGDMVNQAGRNARTFEAVLVRQCAPTLAGMKPGNIFCVKPPVPETVRQRVKMWDERLNPFGLSIQILLERAGSGSMIVYVYRRELLQKVLFNCDSQQFLEKIGYEKADLDGMLKQLAYRLQTQSEFPHEIGVFLGYPLRDVIGFIENRGRNFTCCGFWKSYSDPAEIQACFACYRRCVHTYVKLFEQGIPLEKLAAPA